MLKYTTEYGMEMEHCFTGSDLVDISIVGTNLEVYYQKFGQSPTFGFVLFYESKYT
jgi:hypothetical protein